MSSCAGSFDGKRVGAGHDPVESGIVVENVLDEAAEVAEELTDLFFAGGQTPFREKDLSILGKQVEDARASRGHTLIIESLQVLQSDRLTLLVGHRLFRDSHFLLATPFLAASRYHACVGACIRSAYVDQRGMRLLFFVSHWSNVWSCGFSCRATSALRAATTCFSK